MRAFFLEETANGLPIPAYNFGASGPQVLILGGVHGDEPEGVEAAYALCNRWQKGFAFGLRATVIPALNLDGVIRHRRVNGNGVDLGPPLQRFVPCTTIFTNCFYENICT